MGKLSYKYSGAKALSHSKLELLNTCGRKFELEGKLNLRPFETNMTFAFGHAFGTGAQCIVEGYTLEEAIYLIFCEWELDLLAVGTESEQKANKNFWYAVEAVERFYDLFKDGNLTNLNGGMEFNLLDWEIASIKIDNGEVIPANELEIVVDCGDNYHYECHLDLALRHKETGKFAILDMKTTASTSVSPSNYVNSPQCTGYMMALDTSLQAAYPDEEKEIVNFEVFYIVYMTKSQKFQLFSFHKTPLHRAQFINYIIAQMEVIGAYENLVEAGLNYPPNSKGCFSYFRDCYFMGRCHLPNDMLIGNQDGSAFDNNEEEPHLTVSLDAIIERQLKLVEAYQADDIILVEGSGSNSGLALLEEMTV